uniref:Uncharacterized protein n=1 Tax=Siphoviridae sp. ct1E017 TaxID=2827764 RepID=A0A8S5T016_9CAUD|nr:MAG TPA: hypothetical protein [Siphoviridae sp. ct1E017]
MIFHSFTSFRSLLRPSPFSCYTSLDSHFSCEEREYHGT